MSYEKKTIKEIIEEINSRKIYMPAIQRKYVWNDEQITKLMDSILLGYPIGTFLFWTVNKDVVNSKEYMMYEFIKDYHQRDMYKNQRAPQPFVEGSGNIHAVLDGQQRLTSLYIALQGSLSRKLPNKRWANNDAYPKKELYFNLHSHKKEDEEYSYEFKFMDLKAVENAGKDKLWYLVKDILKYSQNELVTKVIVANNWINDTLAMENISLLQNRLVNDKIINYFEVKSDSIDSVLDIFVRVNSGGTVLSISDLLFSTIVSHWDKGRDEIDELLSDINRIGEGYKFTNDFVMRSCLYVLDMPISLKVETFKKDSVAEIKEKWNSIKNSIEQTVKLLDEFGFNSENVVSYVSIMPIIYYFFNGGKFNEKSKFEIRKYIVTAQLKQIFGAASNSALSSIRSELKKDLTSDFSLNRLQNIRFTGDRSLKYTEEELNSLFDTYEIGSYTFMILSLLYPNLKYSQKGFHQDHMHPWTGFQDSNWENMVSKEGKKIESSKIQEWQFRRNTLANLQLIEGRENVRKNKTPLVEWLKISSNLENTKYLPKGISFELNNFEEFMEERKNLMLEELKSILLSNINSSI